MIEQLELKHLQGEQQLAFRHEFYHSATTAQIKDDIVSYLGEYRFEVPDYEYKMGFSEGKLLDPNTNESMVSKARKAIELRRDSNLSTIREEAELDGLVFLQKQLIENPTGTVIWFSPPGKEEEGYGNYGFAYTGRKEGGKIGMSAIRLESPSMIDFNLIAKEVWDQESEMTAEDFLKTPKVLDIPEDKVREYIHGVFEIKPEKEKAIFQIALQKMDGAIDDATLILRYGTPEQKRKVMAVLENMSIYLRGNLMGSEDEEVVFLEEHKPVSLQDAMLEARYVVEPPAVKGSCGMTGKIESSNFLGKLLSPLENNLNKSDQEWFTCPKCTYKADGPVGNRCPGCGLTKEQFAQEGGESCD